MDYDIKYVDWTVGDLSYLVVVYTNNLEGEMIDITYYTNNSQKKP